MCPLEPQTSDVFYDAAGSDVGSSAAGGPDDCCGPDLAVKVIEPAGPKVKQQQYDYAGSILNHPQLNHEEKQSLLWVLAQSPAFCHHIPSAMIDFHEMPEWKHCSSSRWAVRGWSG